MVKKEEGGGGEEVQGGRGATAMSKSRNGRE